MIKENGEIDYSMIIARKHIKILNEYIKKKEADPKQDKIKVGKLRKDFEDFKKGFRK